MIRRRKYVFLIKKFRNFIKIKKIEINLQRWLIFELNLI